MSNFVNFEDKILNVEAILAVNLHTNYNTMGFNLIQERSRNDAKVIASIMDINGRILYAGFPTAVRAVNFINFIAENKGLKVFNNTLMFDSKNVEMIDFAKSGTINYFNMLAKLGLKDDDVKRVLIEISILGIDSELYIELAPRTINKFVDYIDGKE